MFNTLRISDIQKETPDCVSIKLDIPDELKDDFKFKAGQYLTFRKDINGEDVRRSYSICSDSDDKSSISVAVKQVDGGRFSTFANERLHIGDTLDAMKPMGKFVHEPQADKQSVYLLVAAGSGITPMVSIMHSILKHEPKSKIILLYGNKNIKHIIFKEQIEGLKNIYMDRLETYYFLSRQEGSVPLFNGHISKEKIDLLSKSVVDFEGVNDVYICGPEQMIFDVKDAVIALGVDASNVHFELFSSGSTTAAAKPKLKVLDKDKTIELTIIHQSKVHKYKMSPDENVLDAALSAGTDLPFACKGGVCATCKAKLDDGDVDMALTYGLEQDEIENGYILTCQALPKGECLTVNFDKAL